MGQISLLVDMQVTITNHGKNLEKRITACGILVSPLENERLLIPQTMGAPRIFEPEISMGLVYLQVRKLLHL